MVRKVIFMFELISECNRYMKRCGIPYAICGGWALDLFMNKETRSHSDIDIIVFDEDRKISVDFMVDNGWSIFEHKFDWIDNRKANSYLRQISSNDEKLASLFGVWALKPNCSLIDLDVKVKSDNSGIYDYEIMSNEQSKFDFLEIMFCKCKNGYYIYDEKKNIKRELGKTILDNDNIPYLAPEIILFFISDPAYQKSEYHREKNQSDYMNVAPLLVNESKGWLMDALEIIYPEGNARLEQLRLL